MFFRLIYIFFTHIIIMIYITCSFIQVTFDNNTSSYNIYDVIFMVRDLVSIVNTVIRIIKCVVHYSNDLLTRAFIHNVLGFEFLFFWI